MHLQRYPGLDLPVFDVTERVYLDKPRIKQISELEHDFALRFVQSFGPDDMPLVERLTIAEEEFDKLEQLTQTPTIEHEYGLMPTGDRPHYKIKEHPGIVPAGHILVARVAVVKEIDESKHTPIKVRFGIFRYHNQQGRLVDVKTAQYIYGRNSSTRRPEWRMVDIEPRIRWVDHPSSRKYTRA